MNRIIDLHTHTFYSDGVLLPAELIQRARRKSYKVVGITDHVDHSNYGPILDQLLGAREDLYAYQDIRVLIGVEITHVAPKKIESLVQKCREKGAQIIVGHGESIIEPVEDGTNEAFIKSQIDILAHPGLISENLTRLAKENNVFLEISYRRGHSLSNGYVVKMAQKYAAPLVLDSDAHVASDLFPDFEAYKNLAIAAGLNEDEFNQLYSGLEYFVSNIK